MVDSILLSLSSSCTLCAYCVANLSDKCQGSEHLNLKSHNRFATSGTWPHNPGPQMDSGNHYLEATSEAISGETSDEMERSV